MKSLNYILLLISSSCAEGDFHSQSSECCFDEKPYRPGCGWGAETGPTRQWDKAFADLFFFKIFCYFETRFLGVTLAVLELPL